MKQKSQMKYRKWQHGTRIKEMGKVHETNPPCGSLQFSASLPLDAISLIKDEFPNYRLGKAVKMIVLKHYGLLAEINLSAENTK